MSSRDKAKCSSSTVGKGTPYQNIVELLNDRARVVSFANALGISPHHVRKDDCEQWSILGKAGQVQNADDGRYVLYAAAYSSRKWGAIKRKAAALGWEITQDGEDEGIFFLPLPSELQASFLRSLLGLRKRRLSSNDLPVSNGV